MARIPEAEIERLEHEIALERLFESAGVKLARHGADLMALPRRPRTLVGHHPHMLCHACGFKLANDGHGTRAIQHCLGHRNIALRQDQNLTREVRPSGIAARLVEAW